MSSRSVANVTGPTAAYWLQISVTVACDVADCVDEALEVFGAIAVSRTDAGDSPQFDVAQPGDPRWALQTVTGVFDPSMDVGACTTMLTGIIGEQTTIQVDQLADQDWELCGRTQFQPIKISDQLWVCPPLADGSRYQRFESRYYPRTCFRYGHPSDHATVPDLARRINT